MTGAKHFSFNKDGALSFHLPNTKNRVKAKYVRVTLEASDLYKVDFMDREGVVITTKYDIYADNLRSTFESVTGLATSL
jgi:hypothetical protein